MPNEVFGWVWVFAALALGVVMGLKFQREDWMGGYSAFPRRMVRLAHVALAALGMLNILFAQGAARLRLDASLLRAASISFIAAAVLMPAACLWLAARRRYFGVFALPIACLAAGLILTIGGLLR
jgi:ethanolamine transporter EutH